MIISFHWKTNIYIFQIVQICCKPFDCKDLVEKSSIVSSHLTSKQKSNQDGVLMSLVYVVWGQTCLCITLLSSQISKIYQTLPSFIGMINVGDAHCEALHISKTHLCNKGMITQP